MAARINFHGRSVGERGNALLVKHSLNYTQNRIRSDRAIVLIDPCAEVIKMANHYY